MGISFGRRVWTVSGIHWIVLEIPWVYQDRVSWDHLVLVPVRVLRTLFLGDGVDPTRVGQGPSRMGDYWGGIWEARVVVAVCGLLVVLGQGMVWPLVGLWVV